MPQKGDIADNPKTGESVQFDGTRWVPYREDQISMADSLAMGALKTFTAPVRLLGQAARGVGIDPFPQQDYMAGENYDKVMNQNPAMATTGQLLGLAPGMIAGAAAAPLAVPGAAGVAGMGAVGGILSDAESPLTSAALAVGTLGLLKGATGGAQRIVDSVKSLRAPKPDIAAMVDEAAALGMKVPPSVQTPMGGATETIGRIAESDPILNAVKTRLPGGNVAAENQARISTLAKEAMGLDASRTLTPAVVKEAEAATSSGYQALRAANAGTMPADQALTTIRSTLLQDAFVGSGKVDKQIAKLVGDMPPELDTGHLMQLQSALGDLAKSKKGLAKVRIGAARDDLIESMSQVNDPAVAEQLKALNSQWAAQRAVNSAMGARGSLRTNTLAKVIRADNDTPLGKLGRAAKIADFGRPSQYGTENVSRHGVGWLAPTTLLGTAGYGITR